MNSHAQILSLSLAFSAAHLAQAAAVETPSPYAAPADVLYREAGQTWQQNGYTHGVELRLLDSGVYVMRKSADVSTTYTYSQGLWTQSGEQVTLSFPGASRPVLELRYRMMAACRVLVPADHAEEQDYDAVNFAYVREQDHCPQLLELVPPRKKHCRPPGLVNHIPSRRDAPQPRQGATAADTPPCD